MLQRVLARGQLLSAALQQSAGRPKHDAVLELFAHPDRSSQTPAKVTAKFFDNQAVEQGKAGMRGAAPPASDQNANLRFDFPTCGRRPPRCRCRRPFPAGRGCKHSHGAVEKSPTSHVFEEQRASFSWRNKTNCWRAIASSSRGDRMPTGRRAVAAHGDQKGSLYHRCIIAVSSLSSSQPLPPQAVRLLWMYRFGRNR